MTKHELLHTRFCQEALSFGAAGVSRPGREGKRYSFAVFPTGIGIVYRISLDDMKLECQIDRQADKNNFELREMQQLHAVLSKVATFYFLMNTILEKEEQSES